MNVLGASRGYVRERARRVARASRVEQEIPGVAVVGCVALLIVGIIALVVVGVWLGSVGVIG